MTRAMILVVVLAGCTSGPFAPSEQTPDQCIRERLFRECLASLPKGPERVNNSNDWDEVVSECGSQAYYQSWRLRTLVKPECVGEAR